MTYTLLRGEFVIRYPDLPRTGPQPDGDTVKFRPDTPALVEALPRPSGHGPDINARGISVRLEAIDALETHFGGAHQELLGANAARDALLAELGFTGVVFFPDAPNNVQSADQDTIRGHVLSNGVDANGRMIGFVYAGEASTPDGAQVFLDDALVDQSANVELLRSGLVYPAYYGTLPATLRTHLAGVSRAARAARSAGGIWPRATADPDGAAVVPDLATLETLVIWPKVFRRLVSYFAAGFADFDSLETWLRADPINRDDALFLLDTLEPGNLHDVVKGDGQTIQLTAWPEDFIIEPDPAPPGVITGGRPMRAGDVVIVAALPDPTGLDRGHESVTVINASAAEVTLTGWHLLDGSGAKHGLSGALASGAVQQITLGTALSLGNKGDSLMLVDGSGATVDKVSYVEAAVKPGRTICFGR